MGKHHDEPAAHGHGKAEPRSGSNVQFLHLPPQAFIAGGGGLPAADVPVGLGRGWAFPPRVTSTVYAAFRVPEAVTNVTGLTFELFLAGDPINADPGRSVRLGITAGPFTSGTSTFDENPTTGPLVGTTETLATVATPGNAGVVVVTSVAVPVAGMNGLASTKWGMVRLRRLGGDNADSHRGRVVLLGVDVRDT